jgi:clan AA aspartic protease
MIDLKLTNSTDKGMSDLGQLDPEKVRTRTVRALVDTRATLLSLPEDVVKELGLPVIGRRGVRYADGRRKSVRCVGGLLIEICGRVMSCDALVEPVGTMPLVGQIPLEGLDLIVDPKSQEVRPNPDSPDEPTMMQYFAA